MPLLREFERFTSGGTFISSRKCQTLVSPPAKPGVSLNAIKEGLMKRCIGIFHVILLTLVWSFPKHATAQERLAVLDFKAKFGIEQKLADALSIEIRDVIRYQGDYDVLSRQSLEALAEINAAKQLFKCVNSQCLVRFGKKIGAKLMLTGSISKLDAVYHVHLRLINTQGNSAGIEKFFSEKYACRDDELLTKAQAIVEMIMGKKGPGVPRNQDKPIKMAADRERFVRFFVGKYMTYLPKVMERKGAVFDTDALPIPFRKYDCTHSKIKNTDLEINTENIKWHTFYACGNDQAEFITTLFYGNDPDTIHGNFICKQANFTLKDYSVGEKVDIVYKRIKWFHSE